ncbi:protein APCDD1-like [Tachypleus tridentatus]|uniref:protein APCDD1-like n=1 Tax=Tachypleus tridentatus TaxID=6853 RepID=UPI003FD2904C
MRKENIVLVVIVTGILQLNQEAIAAKRHQPHNRGHAIDESEMCNHWEKLFAQNQESVSATLPPTVAGIWVSERCETRPGPEYLLRKYHFFVNGTFLLEQFYYLDDSCTLPAFFISAIGRITFTQPSWIVPGGMEAEYLVKHVFLVPYSNDMAHNLQHRISRSCPGFVRKPLRSYKKYQVYSYSEGVHHRKGNDVTEVVEDVNCLSSLYITFNELQLMRVEHRRSFHHRHRPRNMRIELFLGDIHTQYHKREQYRPTSYQPPLLKNKHRGCHICHLVTKSNDFSPPQLPARARLPVYMAGEWISTRCEVRPLGMFVTRRMKFFNFNQSWHGVYKYFKDPNCQNPLFVLVAEGEFRAGRPSQRFRGNMNYDFIVEKASITPVDQLFVVNLNGQEDQCGFVDSWRLNITQDVTVSGGCTGIGLTVPSTEFDVVRTDIDHHGNSLLYLGEINTENVPATPEKRPTSYQTPLIQCKAFADYPGKNELFPLPQTQHVMFNSKFSILLHGYSISFVIVAILCGMSLTHVIVK